jgi:uncharacterized membrane protein
LPHEWRGITKGLIAWNIGVWLYLFSSVFLIVHHNSQRLQKIAKQEDKNAPTVLALMSLAAIFSLAAIIWELSNIQYENLFFRLAHYALTIATLMAILFTFHYARLFYQTQLKLPGTLTLRFQQPDGSYDTHPNDWDFLYFSFTIATSAQTSDISICHKATRISVLGQSVLYFFFNLAVLGLFINISAGLIGSH